MANYPIKMLKDEQGTPFVPLVSTQAVRNPDGKTVEDILAAKLSPENIKAGENIIVTQSGSDVTITADVPDTTVLIDNLSTTTAGQGALDARQGNVLLNAIPDVEDNLNSQSTDNALSANQGYILNNRVAPLEEDLEGVKDSLKTLNGNNELDIEDAVEANTVEYKVEGKCEQEVTTKYNLITKGGFSTPTSEQNYYGSIGFAFTPEFDGWCKQSAGSNSHSQFSNSYIKVENIEVQPSTQYTLFIEVKNLTGGIRLQTGGGTDHMFTTDQTIDSNGISKLLVTTKANLTNTVLRFFVNFMNTTNAGSIEYRMMILEGDHRSEDLVYKPYTYNTPTPEGKSDVKTLPSIFNLYDCSKEADALFASEERSIPTGKRVIYTSTNSDDNTNARYIIGDMKDYAGKVIMMSAIAKSSSSNPAFCYLRLCDKDGNFSNTYGVWGSNTTLDDKVTIKMQLPYELDSTYHYLCLVLYSSRMHVALIGDYIDYTNIMLEEGTIAHGYVPHGAYAKVKITGKNLLRIPNSVNQTYNGITTKLLKDGGVKVSGTSTQAGGILLNLDEPLVMNGRYTFSLKCVGTTNARANQQWLLKKSDNVTVTNMNPTIATDTTRANGGEVLDSVATKLQIYTAANATIDMVVYPQLELNNTYTDYEPYQEKEVLIDLSKENLFDSNNYNTFNGYLNGSNVITSGGIQTGIYIPCQPNTTYTIVKENTGTNNRFCVFTTDAIPEIGVTALNYVGTRSGADNNAYYTITTPSNAKYLCVFMRITTTTPTLQEILDSIKIYESNNPTPYHELCKIGDYKDTLSIDGNGNCVINKNIGKVVLNGSESWNLANTNTFTTTKPNNMVSNGAVISDYFINQQAASKNAIWISNTLINITNLTTSTLNDFKTWLGVHNTGVYYVLTTSETINLPNAKIPLFEGINHIYLIDDLETQTEIKYYSESAFSDIYYTKQETDDHIKDLIPEGGQSGQVLMQDANGELTWGDAADPNAIVGDGSIKKIIELTYEEYKALDSVDPDTEYHIIESGSTGSIEYEIRRIIREMDEEKHPIGSLEFNVSGTNPSTYLGFGTWELWGSGRVPVGVDTSQTEFNTVEKTGGEKTHTLTTNEIPTHTHGLYSNAGAESVYNNTPVNTTNGYVDEGTAVRINWQHHGTVAERQTIGTGGGQAHNNLQPYITCYMWKRAA